MNLKMCPFCLTHPELLSSLWMYHPKADCLLSDRAYRVSDWNHRPIETLILKDLDASEIENTDLIFALERMFHFLDWIPVEEALPPNSAKAGYSSIGVMVQCLHGYTTTGFLDGETWWVYDDTKNECHPRRENDPVIYWKLKSPDEVGRYYPAIKVSDLQNENNEDLED